MLRLIFSSLTYMDPIIFLFLYCGVVANYSFLCCSFLNQTEVAIFFFSAFPPPSYAMKVKVLVSQLYLALCDLMDHSLPGSPVHDIL